MKHRPRTNADASVRKMRIIVLELPRIDRVPDQDIADLGEWSYARDVRWGRGNGKEFPRDSYVSEPVPAWSVRLVRRRFRELISHDVTRDYIFARTQCPESYDGFGTITLAQHTIVPEQGLNRGRETLERWVAIRREHEDWQLMRYGSGICGAAVIAR